ncbi:hypothetical protein LSH36_858g00013 [Paralvinella palmiformis]|uniref:Uncharacterized protein n=1 Tax=Paralvinella palmiformis TaxID=53620 RepID=A0AAD9IZ61_9ANNE|nr:hypothetical protein LSH36_858g00013 [Paralvinella palmiformis]
MKTWIIFGLMLCACDAYTGSVATDSTNLCEMDIQPGIFEKKLVPGGTYIYDTTEYQTAEDCMRSCCDQSQNAAATNQLSCNMAYYYQESDPYNPNVLRNVCVWWNCKPGECQPNRNVDPGTTARVGFLLPQEQQQQQFLPEQVASMPQSSVYGADQSGDQYQAYSSQSQQSVPQYNTGNSYQTNQMGPIQQAPANGQYDTQHAIPTNQYNQPIPTSEYQGNELPLSNSVQPVQTGSVPAQDANPQGSWIYDPNTGRYVFVNSAYAVGQQAPSETVSGEQQNVAYLPDGVVPAPNNNTRVVQENTSEEVDEEASSYTTTTTTYTTTGDQGWFWGTWWNSEDKDEGGTDEGDYEDDYNGDDQDDSSNNTDYWQDEDDWEKETEEEEEEWEQELEEWESDSSTKKPYYTTTLSHDELTDIEKEEEGELEDWLQHYEDEEIDDDDDDDDDVIGDDRDADEDGYNNFDYDDSQEPIQPSVITEDGYKPDTFSQNAPSNWSVNTPVIVVGSCAAVVLIALVFILVGKKLAGKTDRAQYRPLKESFSGSSTYHEGI